MKEVRVSTRYAKSLLSLGESRKELDKIHQDILLIGNTIDSNRDLASLLRSPIIKSDKKTKILGAIFAGEVGEVVQKFVNILIFKKREYLLEDVCKEFDKQYKKLRQILTIDVITAVEADDEMRMAFAPLIEKIKQKLNPSGPVELREIIDADILGGFILRAGDIQLDHSVARKFADLRGAFSKNEYIPEI
jgi:F-type H+-transporting ATPase subunit delta